MAPIPFEADLLGNLERALARAGTRVPVVFAPPASGGPGELAALVVAEQRGYRTTELDVLQRRLADLAAWRDEILQHCPYERDLRTGERLPLAPELADLKLQLRALEAERAGHEAALAALDEASMPSRVGRLLARFEIRPGVQKSTWSPRAPDERAFEVLDADTARCPIRTTGCPCAA